MLSTQGDARIVIALSLSLPPLSLSHSPSLARQICTRKSSEISSLPFAWEKSGKVKNYASKVYWLAAPEQPKWAKEFLVT